MPRLFPLEHTFTCIGLAAAGKVDVLAPSGQIRPVGLMFGFNLPN